MTTLVAFAFAAIIASLAAALFFMLRGGKDNEASNKRMAWALTLRIGVSVLVFLLILLGWKLGYIQPHGIRPGQ